MFIAGLIGTCVGSVSAPTVSCAQQLLPADREEIADQERLSWTLSKFPPQPYMNEVYWRYSKDTPAFFRDSLVQVVARTYYFARDNSDGSKSQAWAAGGWLAFRSGLIGLKGTAGKQVGPDGSLIYDLAPIIQFGTPFGCLKSYSA